MWKQKESNPVLKELFTQSLFTETKFSETSWAIRCVSTE